MPSKYGNGTRVLKIKNKLKISCVLQTKSERIFYFMGVLYKTIMPLALVGYEMIIANLYPTRNRGIIVKYHT